MKKVVLITNYFHFACEKESNRYRILCDMICKMPNVSLELITSNFYQRKKEFRQNTIGLTKDLPYKVTFINEIGYKKSVSIRRFRTCKVFGKNVIKYLKSIQKPDVIYQVVPTLDVAYYVAKYAKKNQVPFIVDIQDLWPEAFNMVLNNDFINKVLFFPLKRKANYIYKNADRICAVSDTYVKRALSVNKKVHNGTATFIGINLKQFDANVEQNKVFYNDNRLRIVYCGSLDKSYDIRLVIDALSIIKNPPLFIVVGDGEKKEEFEKYALEKQVEVSFLGYQPYPYMCGILASCDIAVNPIIGTSVATIINKHGDYAAAGIPVLNTQNSEEYINLVDSYLMGINSPSGDSVSLAKNMEILLKDADLREKMGKNARRCAVEKFDRDTTYQQLINTIKSCF